MEQVCTKNLCYLIKFTQKFCVIHKLLYLLCTLYMEQRDVW